MTKPQPAVCHLISDRVNNSPHLDTAKFYWERLILPGDVAVDATCGNGWDALFLAQLPLSALFALDIQEAAIEKTESLLKKQLSDDALQKVRLFHRSHEDLDTLPFPVPPRLIVYNLGYLPGGNKSITTQTKTTLASLKKSLALLSKRGAVSLMCYPGHEEGEKEEAELLQFAGALPSDQWQVCHHRWINRAPRSPTLLWIARLENP